MCWSWAGTPAALLHSNLCIMLILQLQRTLRVGNMWPSAVAAPAVLSDKLLIAPLQITTDVVKRVTGQHLTAAVSRACVVALCAHVVA